MKPALLSVGQIQSALATLPGWRAAADGRLEKEFTFSSYLGGIDFVCKTAQAAEALDHHPDMHVGWRRVLARLTTHSAGGITHLDVDLAARMEAAFTRSLKAAA